MRGYGRRLNYWLPWWATASFLAVLAIILAVFAALAAITRDWEGLALFAAAGAAMGLSAFASWLARADEPISY